MFTQLFHGLQSVINSLSGRLLATSSGKFVVTSSGKYIEIGEPTHVRVGTRLYPVINTGNRLWMTEYLDYQWEGLQVGNGDASTDPYASYYDNDEATYGYNGQKYGLLYNWYAVNYLQTNKATLLPDGWRVAAKLDYDDLISHYTLAQIKAADILNFNTSGGYDLNSQDFDQRYLATWSGTPDSVDLSSAYLFYALSDSASASMAKFDKMFELPVRLVKDL